MVQAKAGRVRIATRQRDDAAGAADRRGVAVLDAHAGGGEFVDRRRHPGLAAVAAEPFLADVVEQNENDIGRPGGKRGGQEQKGEESAKQHRRETRTRGGTVKRPDGASQISNFRFQIGPEP